MRSFLLTLTILLSALTAEAASTQFFGVTKGRRYNQTSTNTGALLTTQGFHFSSFVYAATPTVSAVRKPNNALENLAQVGNRLEISRFFDTIQALNAAYANGNYTIGITNAQDGGKAAVMNLANDLYPNPARVSNWLQAQAIPATQSFSIQWDALGRGVNDPLYVRVEENGTLVFETPINGQAGALNGTSTSVMIPANRLVEGRVYTCRILVFRNAVRDINTIPGAVGVSAYTAETILTIRTRFNVQDVRAFGVEKRVNYEQDGATPVPRANAFEMVAFATGSATDSMTSANFRTPGFVVRNLAAAGIDYSFAESFASQAAIDAAFGGGSYEMRMHTKNNGNRTNQLTLSGAYPSVPQIANINEAQNIRADQAFTLSWNLPDGVAADHLQISVLEGSTVVFSTPPVIGSSGSLNGSQRALLIPAATLNAAKTYTGILRLSRPQMIDSLTYPTAMGVASLARITRFPLKTSSGPSAQPFLQLPSRIGNQTELVFSSVRGERYTIQSSTALPNWENVQTIIAADVSTVFRLPGNDNPFGFYRVIIP